MISTQSTFPVPLAKTQIYLVDDHALVRAGLKALISATLDLEVCGEAEDAEVAMREIVALQPHVTVVDLSLKGESGLELVRKIVARSVPTRLCVLSIYDESIYAIRALKAGAIGYISKHLEAAELLDALRRVARGETVVRGHAGDPAAEQMTDELLQHPAIRLTDRELEIARCIGQGFTSSAIANSLKLSVRAVELHRRRLRQKLHLESGPDLLKFCYELAAGKTEPAPRGDPPAARRETGAPTSEQPHRR